MAVHSRAADAWLPHARGVLAPASATAAPDWGRVWPPVEDEPVDGQRVYRGLGDLGFGHGPAFRGVRAAWTRGEEVFADVALDTATAAHATAFVLHPALLDAVFHAAVAPLAEDRVPLPFAFEGVRLTRPGVSALRVRIARTAPNTFRADAVDETGAPVLSVDAVRVRPVERRTLTRPRGTAPLFDLDWTAVSAPVGADAGHVAVLGDASAFETLRSPIRCADLTELASLRDAPDTVVRRAPRDAGGGAADVHSGVLTALALLRGWISGEHPGRLVIVTHTAAGLPREEPDLVAAAVAGLVRSAQSEHPGRFLLVDHDGEALPPAPLAAALALDEPHLAVRAGRLLAPRLRQLPATASDRPPSFDGGTVLITGGTGGTGGIAAIVARHLVTAYGARHLLLASRRGATADGAAELVTELTARGAHVKIAACDVTERAAVQALLAGIDPDAPLTAVIHTAGVLDDGTLDTLTPAQTARVLAPKVDAALHLHELTRGMDLSAFVLFSSAAPLLGGQGQGDYAAANAAMDALARARRSAGLPAHSLAWGLWTVGMAGVLAGEGAEQYARQIRTRLGLVPIDEESGMALFDHALATDRATPKTALLDTTALGDLARGGTLPTTLIFDHPTAADAAKLVRSRLEEPGTDVAVREPDGVRGTITDLVTAAHSRGALAQVMPLLITSSALSPTYPAGGAAARRPAPARLLARGAAAPALVCVPSFLAGSGPHQFARLARELAGERRVSALSLPGMRVGDELPANWAAAIESLAAAVAAELDRGPVALVGYSAGGALAHAVARRLEHDGRRLEGVAMIDTYSPQDVDLNCRVLTDALGQILSRDNALTPVDDHALVSMGGYVRIYPEREPEPIAAPTLNLRATTTLSSFGDVAPVPDWQHRGPAEYIEADHFSILEKQVTETAAHLRHWLDALDRA
ncbi:SDR family NAD(P)-dependent oxidoreductase [Streptomyces sp. NPDC088757]|uniref:SDR family NAD(P)-dependent oxidoreductase n=1 Tax=Streptomyces sp. NPDC088757 TaxID=3365889 RepID=UPI00382EFC70